jgi:pimeloyl-ACP methyl ester carboxylesterase
VVRGEADGIASEADARAMAAALEVEVRTIAGVGHVTALEAPAEVAEIVADVLERAEQCRSG